MFHRLHQVQTHTCLQQFPHPQATTEIHQDETTGQPCSTKGDAKQHQRTRTFFMNYEIDNAAVHVIRYQKTFHLRSEMPTRSSVSQTTSERHHRSATPMTQEQRNADPQCCMLSMDSDWMCRDFSDREFRKLLVVAASVSRLLGQSCGPETNEEKLETRR